MNTHEIAQAAREYLQALRATVKVDGPIITLEQAGRTLLIETSGDDLFLIGPPPLRGGFQTQVTDTPRVPVNRAELLKRAKAWVREY